MWRVAGCATTEASKWTAAEFGAVIRRAKAYDRAAVADLYNFAVTPVYRYLAARLAGVEDAEELTQEVFLAAIDGLPSLRAEDEAGLLAWLFQIARHKLADHLRRRYRRPEAPLQAASELEDLQARPEELAADGESRAEVRRALAQLTPEQREVILCKFVLDYDNDQTARLLGKTANAVNQLQHRALASLRRRLADAGRNR